MGCHMPWQLQQGTLGMRFRVLVVMALIASPVTASPSNLGCSRSITSGSIMGANIQVLSATQIKLAKDGVPIECGGTLEAGDTGLTFVKDAGTGSQYGRST